MARFMTMHHLRAIKFLVHAIATVVAAPIVFLDAVE